MRLKDHIAFDFLQSGEIADAVFRQSCAEEIELTKDVDLTKYKILGQDNKFKHAELKIGWIWNLASPPLATPALPHTAYYITDTVSEKLDLLKIKKMQSGGYDWTIFNNLPETKKTFIFSKDACLRFTIVGQLISFLYLRDRKKPVMSIVWVDRVTNEKHEAFENELAKSIDELTLYRLLCFFYFSKNEEIIVKPGVKHGARKDPGSLYNESSLDVVIVNNNWNVTSIRNEGFDVSGHFRVQPCGPGLSQKKIIFIDPFKKNGYIRKATKSDKNDDIL